MPRRVVPPGMSNGGTSALPSIARQYHLPVRLYLITFMSVGVPTSDKVKIKVGNLKIQKELFDVRQ